MTVCHPAVQAWIVSYMQSKLMRMVDNMLTKSKLNNKLNVKLVKFRLQSQIMISLLLGKNDNQQSIWWWIYPQSIVLSNGQDSCINMLKFYWKVKAEWKVVYQVTYSMLLKSTKCSLMLVIEWVLIAPTGGLMKLILNNMKMRSTDNHR